MKKVLTYILLVILIIVTFIVIFIYIQNKNKNELYGYWAYKKYLYYENNTLIDEVDNIPSEYLSINENTIKLCTLYADNNTSCNEENYKLTSKYLKIESTSFSLSGTFTYKINKNNLTLTKEENNNKYIYIYNRPSG